MKREIELLIPAFVVLIAPLMIFLSILTRGTCFFRHRQKKYVACVQVDQRIGEEWISCRCAYVGHKYKARWVCEGCGKMGQHCVSGWGDWTVLQGELVPDVKKLGNWGQS